MSEDTTTQDEMPTEPEQPEGSGWFRDPRDETKDRWFDGESWTDATRVAGPDGRTKP